MQDDASLLAADRQARVDALDVTRSFIVQAPAGSGKTELLIQRYLCLLASVADPEEVVAITFTRKAAMEMQLRVIEALARAAKGADGEAEHEQRTMAAARAVLARNAERGWQLPESPRRMRIQTLDAFCASVARLLPVSSGLGGVMKTVADADMGRLYREAAASTLESLAADDNYRASIERVLVHLDNNTANYIDYLAHMLGMRDQWLMIIGAGTDGQADTVRAQLEAGLAAQVMRRLRRAAAALQAAAGDALPRLARYAAEQLEQSSGMAHPLASLPADGWPAIELDQLPLWRAIAAMLLTQTCGIRKTVNSNNGFPPGDDGQKKAFVELLEALRGVQELPDLLVRLKDLPDPEYREAQWQVMLALFQLLPLAAAELKRLFAERGMTDHIEVAIAARRALGSTDEPGDAVMLLDYRIQHLLVDEMQDTSAGQYALLEQLVSGWQPGDGRTLFCVGDPMQSVYRFRDAEVGQFLAARHRGIGPVVLEPLVLRQNFRSGEHLVHWYNTVFEQILPARDDIAAGAIAYSASVPVEQKAGEGGVEIHPLYDASPLDEARCSAAVIRQCLAQDPAHTVTVLVRSRTQLPRLLAELRAASVAYQAIEIDRLTDLPEIIDLLALTRALCHEDDRIAWLGLLRGTWAGLAWRDVHALVQGDRKATVLEFARDPDSIAQLSADGQRRLAQFFGKLVPFLRPHGARCFRERVECAWLTLGGAIAHRTDDELANIYRFLDVLQKLEVAGTLPDVAVLERQLDDERVSSLGSDDCRVQVMTMHKAKGLQFDHVVLHALGRTSGRNDKAVLNWLNVAAADGSSTMLISPLGPRAAVEKDPLYRFIEATARDAECLELDRLLYVACTRARHSLHLVGSVGVDRKQRALRKPPAGSLLYHLWPILEAQFEAHCTESVLDTKDPEEDADSMLAEPVARRLATPWQVPALPPVPGQASDLAAAPADQEVQYYWVGSAARHAGTIVHRWLHRLSGMQPLPQSLPDGARAVSCRWAMALGVADTDLEDVWDRVESAVNRTLLDATGRWLLSGQGDAELRLTGYSHGTIVNVVIDRVRHEGDLHWIVDYKTSTHEGGDLPGFIAQEVERYRAQLRRYQGIYQALRETPTRTALYFPLLQRFVEVE
ncbi:MAG: UvrD-helicase domain-containing protein [Woeseia sp.]